MKNKSVRICNIIRHKRFQLNLRQPHVVNVNFIGSLFVILYRNCFVSCKCFAVVYFPHVLLPMFCFNGSFLNFTYMLNKMFFKHIWAVLSVLSRTLKVSRRQLSQSSSSHCLCLLIGL